MSDKIETLTSSITRLLSAINRRLGEKISITSTPRVVISEYTTITAESTRQYGLQPLLGENLNHYDLKTAEITVRVKDNNPTSPLYNIYANAEAIVSYGLTADENYVIIANQHTTPIDVYVLVVVHPVGEV